MGKMGRMGRMRRGKRRRRRAGQMTSSQMAKGQGSGMRARGRTGREHSSGRGFFRTQGSGASARGPTDHAAPWAAELVECLRSMAAVARAPEPGSV